MKTCTLEQAKRLKELGVEQKSEKWWHPNNEKFPYRLSGGEEVLYAAFDVSELLLMLPQKCPIQISRDSDKYWRVKIDKVSIRSKSPSIGIAEILIDMVWNSVSGFTVAEINERIKQYNETKES